MFPVPLSTPHTLSTPLRVTLWHIKITPSRMANPNLLKPSDALPGGNKGDGVKDADVFAQFSSYAKGVTSEELFPRLTA